jgi:hypothetical protein
MCTCVTNNIDYVKCVCGTCYFVCGEGFIFKNIIVRKLKWPNMEKPHVQLCIVSSFAR